ncbi:MAG: hypothetical protein WAU23_00840, partial [Ferruginibacter sp.]
SLKHRKTDQPYMKWLFMAIIVGLLVTINTFLGVYLIWYSAQIQFSIQSILLLLDLACWTLFFFCLLNETVNRKVIKAMFFFTISIALFLFYHNGKSQPNFHIVVLLNVCKTGFCVLYYQNIFKNVSGENILTEPPFWIVSGVIFYSSLSLPFYGLNSYIRNEFPPLISNNIFSISNIFVIIMYLFFIKAHLCKTHPHKA